MPSSEPVERLDLKFRAEPAPASRILPSPGWWVWCGIAIAVGYAVWWTGRQMLTRRLSDQLATAQSPSEAFLALEGLLTLDANATLEITRGLQHPNPQIARTAYRTLDAQISGWQQLESSVATARMRSLTLRLRELADNTPADNLILAGSLASRIFTICLELEDPQLAPVMTTCEMIFQRIASARANMPLPAALAETEFTEIEQQIKQLAPPPRLPALQSASRAWLAPEQLPVELEPPRTAEGMVPTLLARESLHSSSSTPTNTVHLVTSTVSPRIPSIESGPASLASAGHNSGAVTISLTDESLLPSQPTLVSGAARVETAPLVRMSKLDLDVELEDIPNLPIEQLVRLLASHQPRVPQAAAYALRAKGLPDQSLAMASELATSSAARRLQLVEQIATRSGVEDPRPWLLWMARDGEPEVRQRAVNLLSFQLDLYVERELRQMLASEREPRVAQTIRQVLLLK